MEKKYDVIIVGGGIVGISLALMLTSLKMKIAIVEAFPAKSKSDQTIVLSHSSKTILETLGVWNNFAEHACPIEQIHVSDQGHFGSSKIRAKDERLSALGFVLPADDISRTLQTSLMLTNAPDIFQPAHFLALNYDEGEVKADIRFKDESLTLAAKLIVAADGYHSAVRTFLNIRTTTIDYLQSAIICTLQMKRCHEHIAYERFTDQGPLAMLPLPNQHCAVVWTVDNECASDLLTLSEDKFKSLLQRAFGYRLGKILQCGSRAAIKLQLTRALQQVAPGVVLIGNAVHTLHPVAGQGLNLALRDIAVLAEELQAAQREDRPLGDLRTLHQYLNRRTEDQNQIINLTHSLVGLFSNNLLPLIAARDLGMVVLDRTKWLKRIMTRRTLGLAAPVPRLGCGLALE